MRTLSESILHLIKEDEQGKENNEVIDRVFGPLQGHGIEVKNNTLSFSNFYLKLHVNSDSGEITVFEPGRGVPQAVIKTTNGAITYIAKEFNASSFTYSLRVDESKREIKDTDKLYGHTLEEIKQQPNILDYLDKIYQEHTKNKK